MRQSTVISTHTASKQLRENTIHALWEVTDFFASHTAVVMKTGDNNTHNIIKALAKLREQVDEAQMIDELEQ